MRVAIADATQVDLHEIIRRSPCAEVKDAVITLHTCLALSAESWVGLVDGDVACLWGLVPPTLLADHAYIWLLTTDITDKHKFVLVRYSQIFVQQMLEKYSYLYGHVLATEERSIRWLRWLGAEFDRPDGMKIPFQIRGR